ncbi:flavin reductase family protein [Aquabacter spiritensis]|uniref:Flavin reductase (DIM6/NTAB) family NADH-FMN oxidoreductase RutF n=1 Tax=Aquabacter spiritensis TaxID=933073 RepID=A0A4R3M487_9HYPH|nr:flavin reductase family protein [Aquabacter spiritensis]TCT06167.1 flavin reductase (DIM6/NTAB) family NADH-FMN oxidoreductase RutF [Aquabacter spiritensis]
MQIARDADFDPRAFRQALGRFATGVAIVTAGTPDGTVVGMTMSSFNSVSLDPPLVLFSVARTAHSLPAMRAATGFGINILAQDQQHLSNRFARALADKWQEVEHRRGGNDAPLLDGAIAHFECAPYARHDGGDHEIFLARVLRFSTAQEGEPLIFFGGRYHALAAGAAG